MGQFATSLLYHTYDKSRAEGALLRFASTVLSNPRLALHFKTFESVLEDKPPTSAETFPGDTIRINEVHSLIKTCIAKTQIGDKQYQQAWFDDIFLSDQTDPDESCVYDLDGDQYDALEALLLTFLPSLKGIVCGPRMPSDRMATTLDSASRLGVLNNVTCVDVYVEDGSWVSRI